MKLLIFVNFFNGCLLLLMIAGFYIFGSSTSLAYMYFLGAALSFWAGIKTRRLIVKNPPIDNDTAQLQSHFLQNNSITAKAEELFSTFALAIAWPTYLVLMFFIGIISGAFSSKEKDAPSTREQSALDLGTIFDFLMPVHILVQTSILLFSIWISMSWGELSGTYLLSALVAMVAAGLLSQYLGFLIKPNLPDSFSKSIFKPWVYILISFTLILLSGLAVRENIAAWSGSILSPFEGFSVFTVFKDWSADSSFQFIEIWNQSVSFSDFATNLFTELRALSALKVFDILFMAGMSATFLRNSLSAFRHRLTDEDHAIRAARFLKLGRIKDASDEAALVVDRQTYLANIAHAYLAAGKFERFSDLCEQDVERGPLIRLGYSRKGRLYALLIGFYVSYNVPLSRAYRAFCEVIVPSNDLSLSLAYWRFYSVTHKISLGEICSLYPDDPSMQEIWDYIVIVDKFLEVDDEFFSSIQARFGDLPPAIFLTTATLLGAVGADAKNDRRVELIGNSINTLFKQYVQELTNGAQADGIEPLEVFSIIDIRQAITRLFDVSDDVIVEVANATINHFPDHTPIIEFLKQKLTSSS